MGTTDETPRVGTTSGSSWIRCVHAGHVDSMFPVGYARLPGRVQEHGRFQHGTGVTGIRRMDGPGGRRHQDQIKQMWPGQVSFCAPYDYGFQCTWWACMRQKSLGHDIGQYWGNGGEWDTSARNAGWEQGAQAGGIIVFNPGAGGSSSVYGHVAVVEQVNGDTVHTSEGGTGWGKVATRSFSASHPPAGISYWHPKGGGGAGAESVVQADSPSHSGPASGLATMY